MLGTTTVSTGRYIISPTSHGMILNKGPCYETPNGFQGLALQSKQTVTMVLLRGRYGWFVETVVEYHDLLQGLFMSAFPSWIWPVQVVTMIATTAGLYHSEPDGENQTPTPILHYSDDLASPTCKATSNLPTLCFSKACIGLDVWFCEHSK